MPAITPGYLYTFFALIAVSSVLMVSFMDYSGAIRLSAEKRSLKNLMDYVAAKATELLTLTETTNSTVETFIQAPSAIGNAQYWLRLQNDSSNTWLDGGLGNVPTEETELRVYLPSGTLASGYYIGGYGAIRLICFADRNAPHILLSSSNGG
ncbi:MAG: hypothetical protein QW146_01940 [Candidatus Bathyarchaeia archaeon]